MIAPISRSQTAAPSTPAAHIKTPVQAGVSSFRSSMEIRENAHGVWDCFDWIVDFFKRLFSSASPQLPALTDAEIEPRIDTAFEMVEEKLAELITQHAGFAPGIKVVIVLTYAKSLSEVGSGSTAVVALPIENFDQIQDAKRAAYQKLRDLFLAPNNRERTVTGYHLGVRLTRFSDRQNDRYYVIEQPCKIDYLSNGTPAVAYGARYNAFRDLPTINAFYGYLPQDARTRIQQLLQGQA